MKKLVICLVLVLACAGVISAQSLRDNEYYKKSVDFTRQSEEALALGDYDAARDYAIKAQENAALYKRFLDERMGAAKPAPAAPGEKAAAYRVKPGDCLWKIAQMDFIYGDLTKWQPIYEANKAKFHQPDNPHLIFAGQVFTIPALAGEARGGER